MLIALVTIGLACVLGIALFSLGRDRDREKQETRISVAELNTRMMQHEPFVLVDLRHPLDVLAAPQLIPGAIPVKPDEIDAHLGTLDRDSEIVLYCTCPNEETSLSVHHQLSQRGFKNVKVLIGGLPAWKREKLPLEELYPELEKQLRQQATSKA